MWSITSSFATGTSYHSLWVHAKRHYDLAGITAYWKAWMDKELMKALGGIARCGPIESPQASTTKYEEFVGSAVLRFEREWILVGLGFD